MARVTESHDIPQAYHDGVRARLEGEEKHAPSWLSTQGRSWFLAGWNDKDLELLSKRRQPPVY